MDFENHETNNREEALPTEREINQEIFDRVSAHSAEFDQETASTRLVSPEEINGAWQVREWQIGETSITAIGVSHVPETFLEYREEIEQAIAESDIVVNEYAPEALGMYSESEAERLATIPSNINEAFNLNEIREMYIRNERFTNIGSFHHEIELLTAKYSKDMAIADLAFSKDPEQFLQDDHMATRAKEKLARLEKAGLLVGAAGVAVVSARVFFDQLEKPEPMTRRDFLKAGLAAGVSAGAVLSGLNMEIPEQKAGKGDKYQDDETIDVITNYYRDLALAQALGQISELGYKNVAFIYGTNHLNEVEEYLNNSELTEAELEKSSGFFAEHHPDPFRIYRQVPGLNDSEKFVASKDMVWDRIDD